MYATSEFDSSNSANRLHTVTSPNGLFRAALCNYGAAIVRMEVQVAGAWRNVACGFDAGDDYLRPDNPYFGAVIGRVANRIRDGRFELDGQVVQLAQNNFGHCLHGGEKGFDKATWAAAPAADGLGVAFSLLSPDGDQGFPGELAVTVTYTVADAPRGGTLTLEYEAALVGDAVAHTVVNLTNHSYFNIGAEATIAGTRVQLHTNQHEVVDATSMTTGEVATFPLFGSAPPGVPPAFELGPVEPDVDHCFVLSDDVALDTRASSGLRPMAELYAPATGLHLDAATTEPCFQFYTGKYIDVAGKFPARAGFCLESSRPVNATGVPAWRPSVVLGAGQTYGSRTAFTLYSD
ncbi:galactose mutarotase-like domain-containing protein [Dipodascopsis tothii]|uniref:galactose mutarotase-like domain-containing protein n=1 Tax=Dipodascopsis tothii TaxID=44089 RepID=UPI0034CFA38E